MVTLITIYLILLIVLSILLFLDDTLGYGLAYEGIYHLFEGIIVCSMIGVLIICIYYF